MNKKIMLDFGSRPEVLNLGKPVPVVRDKTERPDGIETGTLKLIDNDEKDIYQTLKILLEDKEEFEKISHGSNPYRDGRSSQHIVDILEVSEYTDV